MFFPNTTCCSPFLPDSKPATANSQRYQDTCENNENDLPALEIAVAKLDLVFCVATASVHAGVEVLTDEGQTRWISVKVKV
jgi:hypothetical protein